ncbi:FAD-binding protein [Gordonia sp. (in: high G+C Gram-positive bacteria)]|uniref:FAD-binding protein n=1 Tax=Gordonia sp. (in: high G+C Gram-positive bacteria) TaxID=84139 RepID=UPI003C77C32A
MPARPSCGEASAILGSTEVVILDFADSGWDGDAPTGSLVNSPARLTSAVAELIAAHRPDVVVTMDPTGSDGHRDHAAIGAATTAAFAATVDWPASLYHWCLPYSLMDRWAREIAATDPDSVYLGTELGRADADVTTVVDGSAVREARRRSIEVHRTQAGPYRTISADLTDAFVTRDHLIRIVPPWTPGPRETELHVPAGGGAASTAHQAGTAEYDAACLAFNVAATPAPTIAVHAGSAAQVRAAVVYAAEQDLPVFPHATGHGAAQPVVGGLLINTAAMNAVTVDPARRTATVGAGARWHQVIEAAAPFGLAPLNGSSPDVGVVGYCLGGGMGPMARTFGFAADHVRSFRMVDARGEERTVDADRESDLFWAMRGGKLPLGVVTETTFDLMPVPDVYGGAVFYPGQTAPAVLHAFREWAPTLPESTTVSVALLRLPDVEPVPPPLRGRLSVHLRYVHVGDDAAGERLLAPMRAVAPPIVDLVGRMPYTAIGSVHQDPTDPMPAWDSSCLLGELTPGAVDAMLEIAGPGRDVPLVIAEFRLLGGALAREPQVANAVSGRHASFLACAVSPYPPPLKDAVDAVGGSLMSALQPWSVGVQANFPDRVIAPGDTARMWSAPVLDRLRTVAAAVDPDRRFAAAW